MTADSNTLELPAAPAERAPAPAAVARIDVSVIVPVMTGDAQVREVVDALGGELDRLQKSWECVLVYDGVRGPAWGAGQRLVEERGARIKLIAFEKPFGESVCLSAGVERSIGRVIFTSPQYVQVDPFEIGAMLAAIEGGADFVTPWRHPRIDPVLNRLQSAGFNWVMRHIVRAQFHDLNCYFRAIRREVLDDLTIYGDMYRFLPLIALRQGYKVVEVKVRHLKEWGGAGFFGVGVYGRRFLDILGVVFLTRFALKPLRFFGTLGAVFAGLGGLITSYLFFQELFFAERGFYNHPLFLIGVMLLVLGVQVIGFGLVGEVIIFTQARNIREYRIERIYE